jgi:sn-glycerol 3-phosphate transport system ATP-binding protein
MATIRLDNVKKSFGKTEVIHGVSIDIEDGEFIVIVGPSGCGKSTLLRMVAGLETITEGTVEIDGRRVNDDEPMDRDIAMVFQNYALYPHMSVFDNMAYGLKIARVPRAEIEQRVNAAAKTLQLEPYLMRKPRELSGGQRQRVAMGRAIVRKPKTFLFDEPLSNLDAKLRVQMRLEIRALQRELGITALYVTHDQIEAMTMADRMIVMRDGVAEQIGSPLEVYENPQSRFVAEFIGSPATNFLAPALVPGAPAGAAWIGIRPEHLRLAEPEGAALTGQVLHIEALGAETLVHIAVYDGVHAVVRQEGHLAKPAEGATVGLSWTANDVMFFDAQDRRIL